LFQGLVRAIKYTKTQIRLHTRNYIHRENGNMLPIIIATEMDANYWSVEYVCYIQERTNGCKQNLACFLTGKLVCYYYKDAIRIKFVNILNRHPRERVGLESSRFMCFTFM
jgi:hypothetical protein